jgi:hypothetical protein
MIGPKAEGSLYRPAVLLHRTPLDRSGNLPTMYDLYCAKRDACEGTGKDCIRASAPQKLGGDRCDCISVHRRVEVHASYMLHRR